MDISRDYKPKLPAKQLAILAIVRFAEPVALTSVFPYLPGMIRSFGIEKDDVARWAGLVGATFSISQSLTAVPWGWASDNFGRKPTILLGLVSTMFCFIAWGMSTSLPMAIAVRAIQGAGSGNVGIIRTMVAEMVTEKELQPKAFSIMPLVWSIGSIFGPAFGGFFARPAEQFPDLFGKSAFLKKFPYVLPNLIAAGLFLISFATAALFLKETLETKRNSRDRGLVLGEKLMSLFGKSKPTHQTRPAFSDEEGSAPLLSAAESQAAEDPPVKAPPEPTLREIITYQTTMVLIGYTFLALHSVAYDQALPVFLDYPRQVHTPDNTRLPFFFSGGFGMTTDSIGAIFTIYGIGSGLIQFLVFPPLCSRFGALNCFKAAVLLSPLIYIFTPYLILIEDEGLQYFVLVGALLVKSFANIIGFPCITILLTNAAPSLKVLGTLNGLATMTSGLGRAVGPAMTGAVFTWGVGHGYMIAPWWLLASIALVGAIPAWFIVEGDGPTARDTKTRPASGNNAAADGELDSEAETLLPDPEDDEEQRQPVASRTIVAGDAADLLGARGGMTEELLLEPDTDSDCPTPPLEPASGSLGSASGPDKLVVKMRRMSATGQELESESRREPTSPAPKRPDDGIAEE